MNKFGTIIGLLTVVFILAPPSVNCISTINPPHPSSSYISQNIRSVAEFESVKELILTWPKWWKSLDRIVESYFINITKETENSTSVNIVVNNQIIKNHVLSELRANNVPLTNITFTLIPTDSIWIVDYGSFFIEEDNHLSIVDFKYDIYGLWRFLDNFFPTFYGIRYHIDYRFDTNFVVSIQGGNYMTDGHGVGFATDRIFQDNPYHSKEKIIDNLKKSLGLDELIVLESQINDGSGHLDMFAKFLDDKTVLVGQYKDQKDINYNILENNSKIFIEHGYNVVRIPMLRDPNSNRQTVWTYANSLIINGTYKKVVLIPQYNTVEDAEAISIYQQLMPEYEMRGINCNSIIKQGGAIHCTTKTVPQI
ncbi:MAG: agmatine deiminase family protein [Euryarchaeota archaeon]|nr:agmatine deiminase family protein [Euryarchaeota archaeon]